MLPLAVVAAAVAWARPPATLTLSGAMPREATARQPLCADTDGFSLHAAVRVEAHDRKRLEQLCRCITRPAPSDERVRLNNAGQVELKLKTPWRDAGTHRELWSVEFMQRLVRSRQSRQLDSQFGSRPSPDRNSGQTRPSARPDSLRLPVSSPLRLIVVLNKKLLEVLGDDVTQEQAFAHANDVLKNAAGGISDIIHIPGAGRKSTSRTSRP